MNVSVRLFAGLRDAVGARTVTLELPELATVVQLKQRLGDDFPAVRAMLDTAVCAIDDEYVAADERIHAGAEVALIPPVSGGCGSRATVSGLLGVDTHRLTGLSTRLGVQPEVIQEML